MANVIETVLTAFLTNDTTVNGIIAGRMSPEVSEQNTPSPRITYERIGTDYLYSNNGVSKLTDGTIRLHCFGQGDLGYSAAKNLAEAVKAATGNGIAMPCTPDFAQLNGFKGTINGVQVSLIKVVDEQDQYWRPLDNQDLGDYETYLDLKCWWMT